MNFHLLLVDFPCGAVYLKYQRNSQKHPTKLEILETYLSTLTNDTVPISITQIMKTKRCEVHVWLYCIELMFTCLVRWFLLRADQV